jgi:eukaryotic-like serine/threonine-protein kinase
MSDNPTDVNGQESIAPDADQTPEQRSGAPASWETAGGRRSRLGSHPDTIAPPLSLAWRFDGAGWIDDSIVTSGNTAVFADRSGRVSAVDVQDQRVMWQYEQTGFVTGAPCISNGRVIAGSSVSVVCLDLVTGEQVWSSRLRQAKDADEAPGVGAILCAKGRVFVCDSRLAVLHEEDGRVAGTTFTGFEARHHTGACCSGDSVFIPCEHEIRRLRLSTGAVDGQVDLAESLTVGPVVGGELLLYGTVRSTLHAVTAKGLIPAWSFQPEGKPVYHEASGAMESRPAYAKGRIFLGAPDGCVYALNAKTGEKIWRRRTRDGLESPPMVAGDIVYVLAANGKFLALSAEDGTELWNHDAGRHLSPASGAPALAGSRVLIGWDDLYVFEPAT